MAVGMGSPARYKKAGGDCQIEVDRVAAGFRGRVLLHERGHLLEILKDTGFAGAHDTRPHPMPRGFV